MTEYSKTTFVIQIARDGGMTDTDFRAAAAVLDFRPYEAVRSFTITGTDNGPATIKARGFRLMTDGFYDIAEIDIIGSDGPLGSRLVVTMGENMDDHILEARPVDAIGRRELYESLCGIVSRRGELYG